jgi:predicted AlkP superfamily phosphohydrolase/phosphomutase
MGTPDLQGGIDGTYAYYTTDLPDNLDRIDDNGGFWQQVRLLNGHTTDATLFGPASPYVRAEAGVHRSAKQLATRRSFTVYVDPKDPVIHVQIEDGDECTLREGEWSGWLRCDFAQGPYSSHPFDWLHLDNRMHGMVKFFLQKAHPDLRLYCSPVNIDPREPCMPISTPDDKAVETLCEEIGPFYTAGLAEETKGLQMGTFDDGEFIAQCEDVNAERRRMFDHALAHFDDGLLFFYFSAIDLRCHMMWRHIEPGHPARDEALAARFARSIEDAYVEMDAALGELRERLGAQTPLIVLSDHGFAPFTRKVNVNQWLRDEGYLALEAGAQKEFDAASARDPKTRSSFTLVEGGGLDRARTRAYAVGFNAIYLNLKGREKDGCVDPADRDRLLEEIKARLLALRDDEQHGRAQVVVRVDKREEVYHGSEAGKGPDLVVGYARGYGASDDTALGTLTLSARARVVEDNKSLWSGNHLMAPEVVPGVFLTNRKIEPKDPNLVDVTATMLSFFGVPVPAQMRGKSLF